MNNIVSQQENVSDKTDFLNNEMEKYKRKFKSVSQNIFLLETKKRDNGDIICQILGNQSKIYKIYLSNQCENSDNVSYKCNCPDSIIRNNVCKHLYWFGITYISKINPEKWDKRDIDLFYEFNKSNRYPIGRNNNCSICLEDIDYENELTICCVSQCKNSVHTDCWNSYFDLSKTTSCVYCRSKWMY